MLKIKDEVDLKELEKFGFSPRYDEKTGEVRAYVKKEETYLGIGIVKEIKETKSQCRIFKAFNRNKIEWRINQYQEYLDIDTLYDLIQAGLVEKVEEGLS